MRSIKIRNALRRLRFSFVVLSVIAATTRAADAVSFTVNIDTSSPSLIGTSAQLAFDLINGDGISNNSAVVSGFTTNGTLGTATRTGGVTGTLPAAITMTDSAFFNELLQPITLGTAIAFTLNVTTNFAGGIPDSFSFFLLNSAGSASLITTNLLGDALLNVDLSGSGVLSVASFTQPNVPIVVTRVNEPGTLTLLFLGFSFILIADLFRPVM